MAHQPTESKRLLSHVIADWACALKYEHLSPEAIQAAKLFWFDSIGCALGGSQQDDAKSCSSTTKRWAAVTAKPPRSFPLQDQSGRCVISEWPHDPRDGLQRHLLEVGSVSSE